MTKDKTIILDSLKDRSISHIAKKRSAQDMYDALITMEQIVNILSKIISENKLTTIRMIDTNIVASYLIKIIYL